MDSPLASMLQSQVVSMKTAKTQLNEREKLSRAQKEVEELSKQKNDLSTRFKAEETHNKKLQNTIQTKENEIRILQNDGKEYKRQMEQMLQSYSYSIGDRPRVCVPPTLLWGYMHQICAADHDTIPNDIIQLCIKFITIIGTKHLTFKPFSETNYKSGKTFYYQHICIDQHKGFDCVSPEELHLEDINDKQASIIGSTSIPTQSNELEAPSKLQSNSFHCGGFVFNDDATIARKELKTEPCNAKQISNDLRNLDRTEKKEEDRIVDTFFDSITKITNSHIAMEQELSQYKAELFDLRTKIKRLQNQNHQLKTETSEPWMLLNNDSDYCMIKRALQSHCGSDWKEYFENFKNEQVTESDLGEISENDIKETLIPKLGPRKRFLKWLRRCDLTQMK